MKSLPLNDSQFYPTPDPLIQKMIAKVNWRRGVQYVLDPSAGKGDLLNAVNSRYTYHKHNTFAIELDPHLATILKEKHAFLDYDFLSHSGDIMFDLIIMNPPFADGDKHLLHALNFIFNGQIVCILNAETIRNPYTNNRKELVKRLKELNAEIEFIENAFITAERKTDVDIVLIYINIENDFDALYCKGLENEQESVIDVEDKTELAVTSEKTASDYVHDYLLTKSRCIKTIINFFKETYSVRRYFSLGIYKSDGQYDLENFNNTGDINRAIVEITTKLKRIYWNKVFKLPQFTEKLTKKELDNFREIIRQNEKLEFNLNNINTLYEHLLNNASTLIEDAIEELFDKITLKYSYHSEKPNEKNIHLYSGWKTNNGYKINRRFILPLYLYASNFMSYERVNKLTDIEKVFNYFNGNRQINLGIGKAYEEWTNDKSKGAIVENDIFKIKIYQKGTVHFTIKDEAILRRFNVFMGKRRQWLPPDYAFKQYEKCSTADKEIINSFEGKKEYTANFGDELIKLSSNQLIGISN